MDDTSSPFFLHPSDNPGLNLVSWPLTSDNYGMLLVPWKSWSHSRRQTVLWMAWNGRVTKVSFPFGPLVLSPRKLMTLKHVLSNITALNDHLMWISESIWWRAGWVSCEHVKPLLECIHMEYVSCFFVGHNDDFSQVRGQIQQMDPILSMNKIFSLIIQEKNEGNLVPWLLNLKHKLHVL